MAFNRQWELLWQQKTENRLPHALLLTGEASVEKLAFAKHFAQACLCKSPTKEGIECRYCSSCLYFLANTHPDFFLIQPEDDGRIIKIDQIRILIESLSKTKHGDAFKIVIIEPAEAMNTAAANALLKTLEEPTPNTLIFLVSHQFSLLPATVRSRCQKMNFSESVEVSNFAQEFQEKFTKDLTQVISEKLDPISMASLYVKIEIKDCLQWLMGFVIDLIHSKMGLSAPKYAIDIQKIDLAKLFFYLDKLYEANKHQQRQMNPNKQLLLENLLVLISDLKQGELSC